MYVSKVFSNKKILKGEYKESDAMLSDISIENQGQKFNYNLYSIFVFEDSKKSFAFKKYVIEDKSIEKEWSKLVFMELNDENKVYDCFEKKFDNITYSRDIGVGNKVIIQKDDDNFKLTIIGNDCEILEVIPLNKNSKVFESENLICFYDNAIYLFVYSDL
jgi:hypothetical protein